MVVCACHFGGLSPWRRKRIRALHCIYLPWVDTDARGQATWRRIGNWSSANGCRGSPGAHNCFSRFELEESIKQKLQGRLRIQLLTAPIETCLFSLERTHFGCGASLAILFFFPFRIPSSMSLRAENRKLLHIRGSKPSLGFVHVAFLHKLIALMYSRSMKMGRSSSYLLLRKFLTYIKLCVKFVRQHCVVFYLKFTRKIHCCGSLSHLHHWRK